MPLTATIIFTFLAHAAILVLFPYGGGMSLPFAFVSSLLWTGFFIFMRQATRTFRRSNAVFFDTAALLVMALAGLGLMPQKDGVPPLYKLIRGQYPDGPQVYAGLARFGIKVPSLLPPEKEKAEEEIRL
ncbi:MAG TPA: hypothetical protein PKK31_03100 [Elusimicrobiales bacterium]|nr:hypothetical protein [Elusimicrobiales bacterium]